jgi:hypothetical protein
MLRKGFLVLSAVSMAIIIACLTCLPVTADIPMSEYITVFFEQEGKPYDRPVRFHIDCYGYKYDPGPQPPTRVPGSYQPEIVYAFGGDCPHYGCKITHSLYLNYVQIEYCDLVAETEGQEYTLPKFASRPVDTCDGEGIECTLRVELPIPAAGVPLSSPRPASATPSPASAALSLSPTPPTGGSWLPFQIASSRAYEEQFLIALFFTLLIEVPMLFAMVRLAFGLRTIGTVRLFIAGVFASCLTLPYLWFIAPVVFDGVYAVIFGEILVFLVEAGVYILVLHLSIRRALLVSFTANLASLVVGLVLL